MLLEHLHKKSYLFKSLVKEYYEGKQSMYNVINVFIGRQTTFFAECETAFTDCVQTLRMFYIQKYRNESIFYNEETLISVIYLA